MNMTHIPGFTAEASLYKAINPYHMIGMFYQADDVINPAQIGSGSSCFRECINNCLQEGFLPFQCGPRCRRECNPPAPTCGPCVGFRQCSDGSQRSCSAP
jgi:hypothetical protein